MRLGAKISSVWTILSARFGRRVPLAVRFQLTDGCTNRCAYCGIWKNRRKEMSTEQVFALLDEMAASGTRRVSFSGGEPLLRKDIGRIVDFAKQRGISPSMNSCGALMEERVAGLGNLDLIKLSVDGPEAVHDEMAGRKGSYAQAIDAARLARKAGIPFTFAATLTRHNIGCLDALLELADEHGTVAAFQPLKKLYRGADAVEELYPEPAVYREALERLIQMKRAGDRRMRNSLPELEHIRHWPDFPELECAAGKLFCIVDVDGTVMSCDRVEHPPGLPNCLETGFAAAFAALPRADCSGCGFCGSLELSLLMNLRLDTASAALRVTRGR